MDRWSRGRVVLIGDAAGCISLLGGEGTGLAITEAYVLAGELARAGGDYRRAFDAYESRLRPFIKAKQAGAARNIPFFATQTRFGLWFRNVAMRTMNFGPLAHAFRRQRARRLRTARLRHIASRGGACGAPGAASGDVSDRPDADTGAAVRNQDDVFQLCRSPAAVVVSNSARRRISRNTTRISTIAKVAPRQRRLPPPNGSQVVGLRVAPSMRSGSNRSGSGYTVGSRAPGRCREPP